MTRFPDHFSAAAAVYAASRPGYPPELFNWLAAEAPSLGCAWDCGTGSGQAARELASRFTTVFATDGSIAQLSHAAAAANIHYAAMTAERAALRARSVSLVTVAQALHWFRLPEFFVEVRRVLIPGGVLAVWSYGLLSVTPRIDRAIGELYHGELGPWWPKERAMVDAGYDTLALPFDEIEAPPFTMEAQWTLDHLAGYLRSWSAVSRYHAALRRDPVTSFVHSLEPLWGPPSARRQVSWPLIVRVGRG